MQDYRKSNAVFAQQAGEWLVSGLFDLMEAHFGDGELDLSRTIASYVDEDIRLAQEFVQTYFQQKPPRAGFAERFPVYMLLDRLIVWEYIQRFGLHNESQAWTLREWAERYVTVIDAGLTGRSV